MSGVEGIGYLQQEDQDQLTMSMIQDTMSNLMMKVKLLTLESISNQATVTKEWKGSYLNDCHYYRLDICCRQKFSSIFQIK